MKVINFDDIKNLNIAPLECYNWASHMILNKERAQLPPKTHLVLENNSFCNVMPSVIPIDDKLIGGVKIVSRFLNREPSLDSKIILFDAQTGENLSLLDGNWITSMRTGAVAAHSINLFAKPNFSTIGIIGLGNTARATFLVLNSIINDRKIVVKLLKYKNQAELFIERFSKFKNIDFRIVNTIEECIKGSEVILSCASYFENDIAKDDWFDDGVLVVPVHTRGFTNCDLFFDKVYADDTNHVNDFKNFSKFKQFAEVSQVVNGIKEGRCNNTEKILAYNIGLSIHDVYFAYKIYSLFKNSEKFNNLDNVEFLETKNKFWV